MLVNGKELNVFKVYPYCVTRPKGMGIMEIYSKEDIDEAIGEIINYNADCTDFNIDFEDDDAVNKFYNEMYSNLWKYFTDNLYLEVGDYCILATEKSKADIKRPNIVYYTNISEDGEIL